MQKSIKKAKILSNTVKFSTESGTYNKLRTRVNSYIADTSNTLNNGNPQIPQPLSSPQISPQFVIFDSIDRDFSAEMVENENFDAKSLYDFNQNPKPLQGMLKKKRKFINDYNMESSDSADNIKINCFYLKQNYQKLLMDIFV